MTFEPTFTKDRLCKYDDECHIHWRRCLPFWWTLSYKNILSVRNNIVSFDVLQGFTLNDCTKDSDCVDGCCKPIGSEVLGYSACMTYIHVNHRCHLNHRDLTSCGCVKGMFVCLFVCI
jgi:hypothetical protein